MKGKGLIGNGDDYFMNKPNIVCIIEELTMKKSIIVIMAVIGMVILSGCVVRPYEPKVTVAKPKVVVKVPADYVIVKAPRRNKKCLKRGKTWYCKR